MARIPAQRELTPPAPELFAHSQDDGFVNRQIYDIDHLHPYASTMAIPAQLTPPTPQLIPHVSRGDGFRQLYGIGLHRYASTMASIPAQQEFTPPTPELTPPTPELIAQFIADHNEQDNCPLFDRIPPEVRNTIFLYALLSYEDLSARFPDDEHYSRPEYRHASHIDPRLLQTCRLIYLETRFLPVMADEHVFWCHRPPPGNRYASNPTQYFASLSEEQKDHVDRVHFFTQQYYLEDEFPRICALPNMRPRSLKITLRHGDWWFWEDNNPLRLKSGWTAGLKDSKRLQEVILELETIERDKEQIYAIADRVHNKKYPLSDGRVLSAADHPLIKREWMGPSRLTHLCYNKERNAWVGRDIEAEEDVPDPGLKYCIVVIKWTAEVSVQGSMLVENSEGDSDGDSDGDGDSYSYGDGGSDGYDDNDGNSDGGSQINYF